MICGICQTNLPDEAIACWKCGSPISERPEGPAKPNVPPNSRAKKDKIDPLFVVLTLLISVALFVCVGWAIPFTVWGSVIAYSGQFPQWSSTIDALSGVLFYASAVGVFAGTWWGSYQILRRLTAKPSG